jgi:hypothetical protein
MHYAGCPENHISARSNESARATHCSSTASRLLSYVQCSVRCRLQDYRVQTTECRSDHRQLETATIVRFLHTKCPLHVAHDSGRHQFCRLVDPCRVATLERREKQCHAAPSAAPVASGNSSQCTVHMQLCSARTQLKCLCSTTIRPPGISLSARAPPSFGLPNRAALASYGP